ncbi:MAG: hypothetical protein FJW80_08580 [Actinobacteria bacterium]|nr:hypothetical protein [Actinomycetota bacterium]
MKPLTPAARRRMDRWVAVGLAVAVSAGLTALIGIRAAESEAAPPAEPDGERAALDAYAEQLTREAARLQAYRQELRDVAAELARGEEADVRVIERIAEETRPPGATSGPSTLDRDTTTWSS